jgi:hypothetical protein
MMEERTKDSVATWAPNQPRGENTEQKNSPPAAVKGKNWFSIAAREVNNELKSAV